MCFMKNSQHTMNLIRVCMTIFQPRRARASRAGVGLGVMLTTPRAFSLVHTTVDGHGEHVGGATRIMNLAGCWKGAQRERPSGDPRLTAGVQP